MSLRFLSKVMPSLALIAATLAVSVSAAAAGEAATGDAIKGKELAYTCLGCHGIESYKNVYPTFSVPRLRGQHPEYIVGALQGYAKGDRSHATMHAHAASLSDQDMHDIAAYLSGEPVKSSGKTVGKPPATVTAVCQQCHGADGVGNQNIYPTISGQHADYLEHALESYRSGGRKNSPTAQLMAQYAKQLKPEELRTLAEYFAKQQPALKTLPMKEKLAAAK
jgi:cytochrome c553